MTTTNPSKSPKSPKSGSDRPQGTGRSEIARIDEVFDRQMRHRPIVRAAGVRERRAKLRRLLAWVEDHRTDIQQAAYDDFRKPAIEVDLTEIYPVVSEAKHAIRHLKRWMRPRRVRAPLALLTTRSRIQIEPKGVALIIAPWNYPFNLIVGPLISAIAAGNCVCLKPSEHTPAMSALLRGMVRDLFEEDEVALFEGEADVAQALLAKPFHHVFFTGSPAVGRIVMKAAAEHLASVTLELGGKSPVIVDRTADLADAAAKIAWGKFVNAGQTCIAPDYVLVQQECFDEFRQRLTERAKAFYGNTAEDRRDSGDYARIVNARHRERLRTMLNSSLEAGASLALGGKVATEDEYFEPTILTEVPAQVPVEAPVEAPTDSGVMSEEIFGPILPLIPFTGLDEALTAINARSKPLALYVFSHDRDTVRRVLDETTAGGTCINEVAIHFLHRNLPFGGINTSGIGSAHGEYGFKAFSHERAVLRHHRFSLLKLMMPPYGKRARRLVEITLKYF